MWVGALARTGKDTNLSCCAAIRIGAEAPTHLKAFLNIAIEVEPIMDVFCLLMGTALKWRGLD
jgi:hypothetical protein